MLLRIKKVFLLLLVLFVTSCLFTGNARAEDTGFIIVFNSQGTRVENGHLIIRLDYYPTPGMKTYLEYPFPVDIDGNPELEQYKLWQAKNPFNQRVFEVDYQSLEYKSGYPGGNITFENWLDSLPHKWITNPALCQSIAISENTTLLELENWIASVITPDVQRTIDDSLTYTNSAHLISPYIQGKSILSYDSVSPANAPPEIVDTDNLSIDEREKLNDYLEFLETVNSRFASISIVSNIESASVSELGPHSIDIGANATDRGSNFPNSYTVIGKENPANATGTLDTIEIYLLNPCDDMEIGTFEQISTNVFTNRDNISLGPVSSGSKQTFTAPGDFSAIDVQTGDYIGIWGNNSGDTERDISGEGYWYLSGDYMDCVSENFTFQPDRTMSVFATGNESGVNIPTVTSDNQSDISQTTAKLFGTINATGGENSDSRGFEWGLSTGNYTDNWTESGNFTTGSYNQTITDLYPGTTYFWRAKAHNSAGWGFGIEKYFTTESGISPPTYFQLTRLTDCHIGIEWTAGGNMTGCLILVSDTTIPNSPTGDFVTAYSGNETDLVLVGYNLDITEYYLSIWTYYGDNFSESYLYASIGGGEMLDLSFETTQFTIVILCVLSIALCLINFFRFNLFIVLAAVFVNLYITRINGAPLGVIVMAYLLMIAEVAAGILKMRSKKGRKRYTG